MNSNSVLIMAIMAIASLAPLVKGHTSAFCTSTSPTFPGRIVFLIGTYHNDAKAPGDITIKNVNTGIGFTGKMVDPGCLLSVPSTQDTEYLGQQIISNCGAQVSQEVGKPHSGQVIFPPDSVFTCYNSYKPSQDVGNKKFLAATVKGKDHACVTGYNVKRYYPIVLSNQKGGQFQANVKNTDAILDQGIGKAFTEPCISINSHTHYLQLDIAAAGKACTGEPRPVAGVAGGKYSQSCANKISGALCEFTCPPGATKIGSAECKDGTWIADTSCTNQKLCDLPTDKQFDPKSNTAVSGTGCGYNTEVGTSCRYGCTTDYLHTGGTIKCVDQGGAKGVWVKEGASQCTHKSQVSNTPTTTTTKCGKGYARPCKDKTKKEIKAEQEQKNKILETKYGGKTFTLSPKLKKVQQKFKPIRGKDEKSPRTSLNGNDADIKMWEPDAKVLQYHKLQIIDISKTVCEELAKLDAQTLRNMIQQGLLNANIAADAEDFKIECTDDATDVDNGNDPDRGAWTGGAN